MSDDKMRKMKKSSFMKPTLASRASSVDTTPPNVTPSVVLAASKQRRALDREACRRLRYVWGRRWSVVSVELAECRFTCIL